MKIKKITDKMGNDFWAIYECEHCGKETKEVSGYNDAHFRDKVIPEVTCADCNKNRAGNIPSQRVFFNTHIPQ